MANGDEQTENSKDRAGGKRKSAASKKERGDGPRLTNAVSDARQSIEGMVDDWRELVDEHPWRALGLALGSGYVLGGGLLTALTGRIFLGALKIGFRLAALPLVRDELKGLFETATDRGRGETERRNQ
jgi:ElaB/YqjD/DUF883 family membrane-anchored ribosome-binding protein